jgi:hypothetical protein
MNITLNLEKPAVGTPPFEFPSHSMGAHWMEDGRISVVAIVQRQDGGFHIMQAILERPLTDEERHQINASNQHQENDE